MDPLEGKHNNAQFEFQDGYPTVTDIELAIERMLVIKHIKNRPEILTTYSSTSKMGPIPGFQTTPYVVDFGVIITGSTVTILILLTDVDFDTLCTLIGNMEMKL